MTSANALIRAEVLPLAARPDGMRSIDCTTCGYLAASKQIARMVARGELVRLRISHRKARYFATSEAAEAWRARNHVTEYSPAEAARKRPARLTLSGPAIVTAATTITIAPPPRDRYAPEPGWERVISSDWAARWANATTRQAKTDAVSRVRLDDGA